MAANTFADTEGARSAPRIGHTGLAPIALFAYDRLWHTCRTIEALQRNELAQESALFVFCDGPVGPGSCTQVRSVREYLRTVTGFKTKVMIERERNMGLAASIIAGVTQICSDYDRVIVLEDDLDTSPFFLRYMNRALEVYASEPRVGSIHGYWYPVTGRAPETFFLRGASCWGWATWSRAWREFRADGAGLLAELRRQNLTRSFDLDGTIAYTRMLEDQICGRIDSWAIRWHASMFLADRLQLSPGVSLVRNTGFDGSGTHCTRTDVFATELSTAPIQVRHMPPVENAQARAMLIDYYRRSSGTFTRRVARRLRRALVALRSQEVH